MKIQIALEMPEPKAEKSSEKLLPLSVEDKVRSALDLIDSGHESRVEWSMINRLYKALCNAPKKNKRMQNLLDMIEPVLAKYGFSEVSAVDRERAGS